MKRNTHEEYSCLNHGIIIKSDEEFVEILEKLNTVRSMFDNKAPEVDFVKLTLFRIQDLLERYSKATDNNESEETFLILRVALLENIFVLETAKNIEKGLK